LPDFLEAMYLAKPAGMAMLCVPVVILVE
jgi:hypothetical protein